MEDRDLVEKHLKRLNNGKIEGDWDESDGFVMMPSATFNSETGSYDINMQRGLSMKLFINKKTGQTEVWWADVFVRNVKNGSS